MIGIWLGADKARQFASPYLYTGNGFSPINGVDKDGNEIIGSFNNFIFENCFI